MKTKKLILFLILNYLYKAKAFTTIEDIERKNLLQLEQENSELIEGTQWNLNSRDINYLDNL